MRRLRDEHIVRYRLGRALIRAYWVMGPVIAKRVSPDSVLGKATRRGVSAIVGAMR